MGFTGRATIRLSTDPGVTLPVTFLQTKQECSVGGFAVQSPLQTASQHSVV